MSDVEARWKPYGATTREHYLCDFCRRGSRRNLLGWSYRSLRGRGARWTQRICGVCATKYGLPGPDQQVHRSASAQW